MSMWHHSSKRRQEVAAVPGRVAGPQGDPAPSPGTLCQSVEGGRLSVGDICGLSHSRRAWENTDPGELEVATFSHPVSMVACDHSATIN